MSKKHLGLKLLGEGSIYPVFKCKKCGQDLWTWKVNGRTYLYTKDQKRHYKHRCTFNEQPKQERTP